MTISTPGISDTPTEMVDRILDFLHDDRPALFAASLVSREWVSAPRYHLFNQMVINEYFIRGDLIEQNVHSFLTLAQSEHCTILHAIRRLILMVMDPELIKDVIDILVLSKAVPSQIVYIHQIQLASILWNAHTFHNVHDFTFNMEWHAFNDEAWRLVTSFPSLRTLAVYTDSAATVTMPPDISGSAFHNLRTLRLKLLASEELLEYLKNLDGSHLALETFDLRMFRSCHRGWGRVKALNAFLKSISDTLKHLRLSIEIDHILVPKSLNKGPTIDLRPLVNLSSLFLRTHDMRAVCDSLASLSPSSSLEDLNVHILPWTIDQFNEIKECDCIPDSLLERFAGMMVRKPLIGVKLLELNYENLHLTTGPNYLAVTELLKEWHKGGALGLASDSDDDSQENSLRSIGHLVYTHARQRP